MINTLEINHIAEKSNFAIMLKAIHIGKKIKEILDKTPLSVVDFAKSINLTRNGAYKVFEKETIDTGQLQKIGKVLNHDFFNYYSVNPLTQTKETKTDYGYATKEELLEIAQAVQLLTKEIAKLREEALASSATVKFKVANVKAAKKYAKKK